MYGYGGESQTLERFRQAQMLLQLGGLETKTKVQGVVLWQSQKSSWRLRSSRAFKGGIASIS